MLAKQQPTKVLFYLLLMILIFLKIVRVVEEDY